MRNRCAGWLGLVEGLDVVDVLSVSFELRDPTDPRRLCLDQRPPSAQHWVLHACDAAAYCGVVYSWAALLLSKRPARHGLHDAGIVWKNVSRFLMRWRSSGAPRCMFADLQTAE